MRTKLDGDTDGHNEVYQRHRVEGNVPVEHESAKVHNNHCDGDADDNRRVDVEAHQQECDDEDGQYRDSHAAQRVRPHRQVLFVENVEHRVRKDFDLLDLRLRPVSESHRCMNCLRDVRRNLSRGSQSFKVIFGRLQDRVVSHKVTGINLTLFHIDSRAIGGVSTFCTVVIRVVLQEETHVLFELAGVRSFPFVQFDLARFAIVF